MPMGRAWTHFAGIVVLLALCAAAYWGSSVFSGSQSTSIATDASGLGLVRWSHRSTWNGGAPAKGVRVVIPRGVSVLLDASPPPLGSLEVDGSLIFARQDVSLISDSIVVRGLLEAGTEEAPFANHASITLAGRAPAKGVDDARAGGLLVEGGRLELHGQADGPSWTRLAQTAAAGTTELVLGESVAWRARQHLVVAPTGPDPSEAEEVTVTSAAGNIVVLGQPLRFTRLGDTTFSTEGVEIPRRAEVGLISRNILVQGAADAEVSGFGGHIMVMATSSAHIAGVELFRMGQGGRLARYPFHFHLAGDMSGSFVVDSSIHHSFNRCLTLHGTDNVLVEGNVAYDDIGHCYFFEDGIEQGNVLRGNLGVLTRAAKPREALLPSDLTPATYWLSNPANVLEANTAAGSEGYGFWIDPPLHPTGLSRTDYTDAAIWPRRLPLREFENNITHSNILPGLLVGRVGGDDDYVLYTPRETAVPPPGGTTDREKIAVIDQLLSYGNRSLDAAVVGDAVRLVGAHLDRLDPTISRFRSLEGQGRATILVEQVADRFYWGPNILRGSPGQQIKLTVNNPTSDEHNLAIAGEAPIAIPPGGSVSVDFRFPQSGTLSFVCQYHAAIGMQGQFLVGDAAPTVSDAIYGGGFPGY